MRARSGEAAVDVAWPAGAVGALLAGVGEQAGCLDVATEVRRVDRLAAERLVELLRLAEGEAVGQEAASHAHEPALVRHAGAQAPEAVVDDPGVVEREGWELVDRVP